MVEQVITVLLSENQHNPSTLLLMDSSASSSHGELELEMSHHSQLTRPPDINLPVFELSQQPSLWNLDPFDMLDVGLGPQVHEKDLELGPIPKISRKCTKRVDSIWGAWFFFSFYFKPVLNEKSKVKIVCDSNGVSGFDKSDLKLDAFMVQHDMENLYMWVFKDRPENALGKMQLRSFMNGHSRQGDKPFPFSVDKGFVRSHRMQRKHYRGLSNPQCVHGIEVVPSPDLTCISLDERKRWMELTGRDLNFSIPFEASNFGTWRTHISTDVEVEKGHTNPKSKKVLNGSVLNLSVQPSSHTNGEVKDLSPMSKKRKDFLNGNDHDLCLAVNPIPSHIPVIEIDSPERHWLHDFSGVMRNVYGPVTAAKTIYEDEMGYLIIVSLPFVSLEMVKVSWRNTVTHGVIKLSCVSTSRVPCIKRNERTFKLTDPYSEHCPQGEFVREINLATRIPENANIEAYYNEGPANALEILVPKVPVIPEEHEVRVRLRPHLESNDLSLT